MERKTVVSVANQMEWSFRRNGPRNFVQEHGTSIMKQTELEPVTILCQIGRYSELNE